MAMRSLTSNHWGWYYNWLIRIRIDGASLLAWPLAGDPRPYAHVWVKSPESEENTFPGLPDMGAQCSVIPKLAGEGLKGVTIRLEGYGWWDETKSLDENWTVWTDFMWTGCVSLSWIVGVIIMSDWGTCSLPSIVNLKQHRIPGGQKEINTLINDTLEVLTNAL